MCLSKVEQVAEPIYKDGKKVSHTYLKHNKKFGYKIFQRRTHFNGYSPCYKMTLDVYKKNEWYTSTNGNIKRYSNYNQYERGFHIFNSRKDAREANKDRKDQLINSCVVKVEYTDIVAIGEETQFGDIPRKTIVAKKMRIVGR